MFKVEDWGRGASAVYAGGESTGEEQAEDGERREEDAAMTERDRDE
jgi:hypothetical protein